MSSISSCFCGAIASLLRPGGGKQRRRGSVQCREPVRHEDREHTPLAWIPEGEALQGVAAWSIDDHEEDSPSHRSPATSRRSRRTLSSASAAFRCRTPRHLLSASLGVIRLDYHYPTQAGDIDDPESFAYPVVYRAVPGLTFEMCQAGHMTPEVEKYFVEAIRYLDEDMGVSAITGDCGFMLWFQELARKHTLKPIVMSSLCMLPSITNMVSPHGKIAIFTANSETLEPMHDLIKRMCGLEVHDERYIIVGCEDVPGFEPIFDGRKVDYGLVESGVVARALRVMQEHPVAAFLFECTQLPATSDAVRAATRRPVFDAVTAADSTINAFEFNPRFGITEWDSAWDGVRKPYVLGDCLTPQSRQKLVTINRGHTNASILGVS